MVGALTAARQGTRSSCFILDDGLIYAMPPHPADSLNTELPAKQG